MLEHGENIFPEKETVMRPSNATETTPLSLSNELCRKLRRERQDETGAFSDASATAARYKSDVSTHGSSRKRNDVRQNLAYPRLFLPSECISTLKPSKIYGLTDAPDSTT